MTEEEEIVRYEEQRRRYWEIYWLLMGCSF